MHTSHIYKISFKKPDKYQPWSGIYRYEHLHSLKIILHFKPSVEEVTTSIRDFIQNVAMGVVHLNSLK